MHAVLIAGETWLDQELALFRQLVIGLIDEMVRVSQVVPPRFPDDELVSFSPRFGFEAVGRWGFKRHRVHRLAEAIKPQEPELIHGLDGESWATAVALSSSLDLPLVLSIFSFDDLAMLPGVLRKVDSGRLILLPASSGIAEAAAGLVPKGVEMRTCLPGVMPGRDSEQTSRGSTGFCALVSAPGEFDSSYSMFLDAVASLLAEDSEPQFFIDGPPAQQHAIWRKARRLDLLRNITMIDTQTARRQVLAGLDALFLPRASGQCRSLTLRAMAGAMPVIGMEDPANDFLIHEETAWLLKEGTPEGWKKLLVRWRTRPEDAAQLGKRGQEWVNQHARPSNFILGNLEAYRHLTGESIPFAAQTNAEPEGA
ncbi:MAG: hypothetical protein JJU36_07650 [Phycisphaeraceae bacterium]|nr:hypothetical protein [Phycisphaeraceae bacterium]